MPRLLSACAAVATLIHVVSGFNTASSFKAFSGPSTALRSRCAHNAAAQWTCQAADDGYKIVPSQLEGTGGGWTIQGVKPVSSWRPLLLLQPGKTDAKGMYFCSLQHRGRSGPDRDQGSVRCRRWELAPLDESTLALTFCPEPRCGKLFPYKCASIFRQIYMSCKSDP